MDKVFERNIPITVEDSAYLCNKFIYNFSKRDNGAVTTRMRANIATYEKYEGKQKGSGRKRKYGKKYLLNKPNSLLDSDYVEKCTTTTNKRLGLQIRLSLYKVYIYTEEVRIIQCQAYQ